MPKPDLGATRISRVRQTISLDNRPLRPRTCSDSADVAARCSSRRNRPFWDLSRRRSTVRVECLWCPGLYQSGSQAVRGLLMGYELWSLAVWWILLLSLSRPYSLPRPRRGLPFALALCVPPLSRSSSLSPSPLALLRTVFSFLRLPTPGSALRQTHGKS